MYIFNLELAPAPIHDHIYIYRFCRRIISAPIHCIYWTMNDCTHPVVYSGWPHENWGKRWSFCMAICSLYYDNISSQLWKTGSTDHIVLVTICFSRLCIFTKIGKKAAVCHIHQLMNFFIWYANSIRVLGITKCETSRHIFSRRHGHR